MTNQNDHKLVISIDIDSPIKLMEFYKINNVDFDQNKLELFYRIAWERALAFFDKHNIKATFFVVGDELENSEVIKNIVSQAFIAGHEIENHTYSHPFGLASLSDEKIKEDEKAYFHNKCRHKGLFRIACFQSLSQMFGNECPINGISPKFFIVQRANLAHGKSIS